MPDTATVKTGQVWADNDPRNAGRHLRVVEVGDTHALCEPVTVTPQGAIARKPGRHPFIRLDRFHPTSSGYRLITDA